MRVCDKEGCKSMATVAMEAGRMCLRHASQHTFESVPETKAVKKTPKRNVAEPPRKRGEWKSER